MLKLEDFYCANPEPGFVGYSKFIHGDNREEKASVGGGPSYSREA